MFSNLAAGTLTLELFDTNINSCVDTFFRARIEVARALLVGAKKLEYSVASKMECVFT